MIQQTSVMRWMVPLCVAGLAVWGLTAGVAQAKGGKGAPKGAAAKEDAATALRRIQELELQRAPAADVLAYMKHGDASVRARAAVALGRLQDWTVAESTVEYLSDPDVTVRRNTAFALGQLDPVMPLLVTQIKAGKKGDDPNVKGPALARAAAEKKVDARLHMEDRQDVRRALYAALGPLAIGAGLHHLQFGLEAGEDEAAWAARGLGVHGYRRKTDAVQDKEILDALRKLLTARGDDTRFGATYALFRLNANEVGLLSERLGTDSDARVRLYAARGLSGRPGAEDVLVAALRDPDWRVRLEALRGLSEAPRPRGLTNTGDIAAMGKASLDALQLYLKGEGLTNVAMAHVVVGGATALAKATPGLGTAQLDAMAAVLGVANSGSVTAAAAATTRSPEPLAAVKCAVARALDIVTGGPTRVLTCRPNEPAWKAQARAVNVLVGMPGSDGEKARRLSGYLRHENAHVRLAAAEELASLDQVKAPDVGTVLAEALADETDAGAAYAMADGLIKRAETAHIPALRAALKRFSTGAPGDPAEATTALVAALAAAKATAAVEDIKPVLQSPSVRARHAAHAALTALGASPGPLPLRDPPFWPEEPGKLPGRAVIKTAYGDITLRFYKDDAPLTVTSFVRLARKGFFRNQTFHRVVGDFVIQGGDPRADGFGGPGYQIPCEYNARPYERGVVGMALSGKDSGGSQFFITHSPQPHLDGQYTAFAEVESGLEVVDAIQPDDLIQDILIP